MFYRIIIGALAFGATMYHGLYAGFFVLMVAALWDIAEAIRESK